MTEGEVLVPRELVCRKTVVRMTSELLEIISRGGPIEHTPAQDFALDAIRDLRDAVLNPAALPSFSPPKEAEPWRPIEEHDNSSTEVQVMVPGYKAPISAWRHHPSSRTDIWFSLPGKYQVRPTHFRALPPAPNQPETGQ